MRWLVVADIAPAPSPSDHRPILDALRVLPIDGLPFRAAAEAALAPAIRDLGLCSFLLQNFVHVATGGQRWRIYLDAIATALPDLTDFPSTAPDAVYEGPTLFERGERSDYVAAHHEPRIGALFPAASVVTVAGAGHWRHAEYRGRRAVDGGGAGVQVGGGLETKQLVADFLT